MIYTYIIIYIVRIGSLQQSAHTIDTLAGVLNLSDVETALADAAAPTATAVDGAVPAVAVGLAGDDPHMPRVTASLSVTPCNNITWLQIFWIPNTSPGETIACVYLTVSCLRRDVGEVVG